MTYTREEIEEKLVALEGSQDPKARDLARSIREQLVDFDADATEDEEALPGGLPEANAEGTSFKVTSAAEVQAVRDLLEEGKRTYRTNGAS